MLIDLHTHTSCSDGRLSPLELVTKAQDLGLTWLAVTDHETLEAHHLLSDLSTSKTGVIKGIEITTNTKCDFLGLGLVDPSPQLEAYLEKHLHARRMAKMCLTLVAKTLGLEKEAELLHPYLTCSHLTKGWLCEAIKRARQSLGIAEMGDEFELARRLRRAVRAYVEDNGGSFVAPSPEDASAMIRSSNGIVVLAHPVRSCGSVADVRDRVEQWPKDILDAIEVIHPSHQREDEISLRNYCAKAGLLTSGGTDYHGHPTNPPIGVEAGSLSILERLVQ